MLWRSGIENAQLVSKYIVLNDYLFEILYLSTDPDRPAPYVPPPPTEDEEEIFSCIQKGINFDKYDKIPVEVTGGDCPQYIRSFDEAGLGDAFLANVKKAKFEKPTPVQKYAIPIIMAGRDLMACAQTGSGKTVGWPKLNYFKLVILPVPEIVYH